MSALKLAENVGQLVYLEPVTGLKFACIVLDAKLAYGQLRLRVEACTGQGWAWVNAASTSKLTLAEAKELVK